MTPWERWVHRPQRLWFRRIFFQVHLWAGVAVGLYVAAISISGSALVSSPQLARKLRRTVVVADEGYTRMTVDEGATKRPTAYTRLMSVTGPPLPDQPNVVVPEGRSGRIVRLFDPFTGADLGDPRTALDRPCDGSHDNLLVGLTGRTLNKYWCVGGCALRFGKLRSPRKLAINPTCTGRIRQ
jgi:uncharacterized iron-regulated membrane protein